MINRTENNHRPLRRSIHFVQQVLMTSGLNEVCPTLLHMLINGNRTPDLFDLQFNLYPLGNLFPPWTSVSAFLLPHILPPFIYFLCFFLPYWLFHIPHTVVCVCWRLGGEFVHACILYQSRWGDEKWTEERTKMAGGIAKGRWNSRVLCYTGGNKVPNEWHRVSGKRILGKRIY